MSPLQASHEDTNKINQIIDFWLSSPMRRRFCAQRSLPPSAERTAGQLDQLDRRLVTGLRQLGIVELYEHQWRSLQACGRGHDVVVATPTASGKTLCYNLPVLQSLLSDPAARAIYIFPTKALARDQTEALRRLAAACSVPLGIAVYDGDTPPAERRAARKARIIATNPEMLHTGILPHHPSWAELLSGVTHVVVDELHVYRGVFGSHVANVLRRLRRVALFHGAKPRFVGTSATIANPEELASTLFGGPVEVIRQSGAPSGPRHFLIYNPPPSTRAWAYVRAISKLRAS